MQRERYHPAEAAHLTARQLVLGMRGQSRVHDAGDVVALGEEGRDGLRVAFVLAHPHR